MRPIINPCKHYADNLIMDRCVWMRTVGLSQEKVVVRYVGKSSNFKWARVITDDGVEHRVKFHNLFEILGWEAE